VASHQLRQQLSKTPKEPISNNMSQKLSLKRGLRVILHINLLVFWFVFVPQVQAMSSSNYRIDAYEINSFGGVGSSTNYKLTSSGGEPFIKEGASENYKLGPGFPYEISYSMLVGFYNNSEGIYKSDLPWNVNLGNLQAGSPVTASTDIKVKTDTSYSIAVKRSDSDTTIDLTTNSSINISDKTAWDPEANSGNGNAASWSGTGLGFCVFASNNYKNTTWWGTGASVDDSNNKYAGFPTSDKTIMRQNSYSVTGETTTSVGYKLDVTPGQASGYYDGIIVYTVTMAL